MFLVIGTYVKPLSDVEAELQNHYEFLEKHFSAGDFIVAGRRVPRTGGVIICNGADRNELEKILREDPFYQKNIMEYEIVEFTPTKYAHGFEDFLI